MILAPNLVQTEIWTRFGAKIDAELESLKVLGGEVMAPGFIGSGEKRMIMTAMEDSDKRIGEIEIQEHPPYWNLD